MGKVLRITFRTPIKTHKGVENLFVNKQLFWWSASITSDNNNAVLMDLYAFFSLNTSPHTSVSLTSCISNVFFSFEYFDPFDHYAVLGHFNVFHKTVNLNC